MRRLYLLPLLLLPGLAFADNRGELAFNKACKGCHITGAAAAQEARAQANVADLTRRQRQERQERQKHRVLRLGKLLKTRTPEQVQAWIRSPQAIRKDSSCDTRGLRPEEIDSVMTYLATSARPPPKLSREQQLRQDIQKTVAARRAKRAAKAKETPSTTQGKK